MDNRAFVERLKVVRSLNSKNPNHINRDIYRLVISRPALLAGYERIKSNKGATTPSTYNETLDSFGIVRLDNLRSSLCDESWKPKPARRVMIPKPGKSTKRPLGVQGPEEKIVQAALLIVLEAIYEPIFSPYSFGFRPGRGAHDALRDLEQKYDNLTYAIEGDIQGMYDNVNHHTLIDLISSKIVDSRLISLIWKLLRAGYIENTQLNIPELGTPQGSIVSPLLANIYLHELDKFMDTLIVKGKGKKRLKKRTPFSKQIRSEIQIQKRKVDNMKKGQDRDVEVKVLKSLKMKNILGRTYVDPENRLFYHRYADDFIIGIAGSLKFTEYIRGQVGIRLEGLNLQLNPEKTKITPLRKDKARFLGYDVSIGSNRKIRKIFPKGKAPFLKGTTGWFVYLEAPMSSIISRLCTKSFCDRNGFPVPKKIWTVMPDYQIVDAYNVSLAGILQYYSGACHRNVLRRLMYIFRFSCAMTIATKHRSSINKVFKKHGKHLNIVYGTSGEKSIQFREFDVFREKDKNWNLGKQLPDPYRNIALRLTKSKLFSSCCICGESVTEMHHIRHVRGYRSSTFGHIMGVINRKQIPVCKTCHVNIHTGRYDGIALSDFANPYLAKL